MEKLMQLEKEEKVFVIAPESTYGVGRTETVSYTHLDVYKRQV